MVIKQTTIHSNKARNHTVHFIQPGPWYVEYPADNAQEWIIRGLNIWFSQSTISEKVLGEL